MPTRMKRRTIFTRAINVSKSPQSNELHVPLVFFVVFSCNPSSYSPFVGVHVSLILASTIQIIQAPFIQLSNYPRQSRPSPFPPSRATWFHQSRMYSYQLSRAFLLCANLKHVEWCVEAAWYKSV